MPAAKIVYSYIGDGVNFSFFDANWFSLKPECNDYFKGGRKCDRNSVVLINNEPKCYCHVPKKLRSHVDDYQKRVDKIREDSQNQWLDEVEHRIISIYEKAKEYRRVPACELIGHFLLEELQDYKCIICLKSGEKESLIEDHCHETGMVRGLLCKGCNTVEGMSKGDSRPWGIYRKYAPGNGLFIRYNGMGKQWENYLEDPLPNRVNVNISVDDIVNGKIKIRLDQYRNLIASMPDTIIPYTCHRKFDRLGSSILFDNEEIIFDTEKDMLKTITLKPEPSLLT